jgi:hypothetical protein
MMKLLNFVSEMSIKELDRSKELSDVPSIERDDLNSEICVFRTGECSGRSEDDDSRHKTATICRTSRSFQYCGKRPATLFGAQALFFPMANLM